VLILIVAFAGVQFIPAKRNQSNTVSASDFMSVYNVPKYIEAKIKVSCYDCHSNNTNYPWYNKVQPFALILEDHITEGKEELNFSEFGGYSIRRQRTRLKSISSQIIDDKMPLLSYTFMHRDSKLTLSDKELIINWIEKLKDSI
jgi:hypothetical protein